MPEPSRYIPIPEAMILRWWNQTHRFLNIFTSAQTLTPSSGKRIVIPWMRFQSDMTAAVCTITCTGVDTVTIRYSSSYPPMSSDAVLIGATDQGVTFTKGGSVGGYSEVWLTYYEL